MIEFGAKLSLKDNMAATLQKNLDIQRQFTQQVSQTDASIKSLGKARANPTISATDDASEVIDTVREGLDLANGMVSSSTLSATDEASEIIEQVREGLDSVNSQRANATIEVNDEATSRLDRIKQAILSAGSVRIAPRAEIDDKATAKADKIAGKLKEVGRFIASPVVKLVDAASQGIAKVKNALVLVGKTIAYPALKLKDAATTGINKVRVALSTVGKLIAKPAIAIKDKASPIVNKVKNGLKAVGKTVAKPFIAIKDTASKIISKVKDGLKSVGSTVAKATVAIKDAASAGLDKIKSTLATLAKGVTIAVGIAGAGVTASLMQGASLEQSIGGVETLFKGDAGVVKANADKAFQTAGLSANEYMETVTGFSASLLQSLGNDTAKAAGIADMAVIDMADNANKFGTDMSSIQNAYQGFAKQNYTMLDNLKLGYGGTKEEMERLLVDAGKLSGQTYDISNLSDVYNAIHVIQSELGVTGTTAKEAGETFSGSFAAMKSAAKNLLGNLAIGGDVAGSMEALVDTAATFVAGNLIPMVANIFTGLPTAIKTGVSKAAPKIKAALQEALPPSTFNFLTGAFDTVKNIINTFKPVVEQLGAMFADVAPKIVDTLGGAFGDGGGFIQGFADAISMAIPTIGNLLTGVADVVAVIMPVLSSLGDAFLQVFPSILDVVDAVIPALMPILESLGTVIQTIIPVVADIIQVFAGIVADVFPIVSEVITAVINAAMPIIQALASVIQQALPVVQQIIQTVTGVIQAVFPIVSQIFQEVGAKIAEVINTVVTPVMNVLSQVFQTVAPIIQSAIEIVAQVFSAAWDIVSPIIDLAMAIFNALWSVVEAVFPAIQNTISAVWSVLEPIFGAISKGLSMVGDAISKVGGWIGGAIDTVGGWLGFAYGKDRVPYNNYPAVLHEGEKVLTRNQADQYDRVMSTRGVELSPTIKPMDMSTTSSQPIGNVQEVTEVKQENKGANITIEKLADTVVIEKEADVDKVVQDMVTKFRKLVPNMA